MLEEVLKVRTVATLDRTTTYHAEVDGDHAYASLATAKGLITQALTWWPVIGQRFSPFPLKTASRKGCAVL